MAQDRDLTASAIGRFERLFNDGTPAEAGPSTGARAPAPGRKLLPGSPYQAITVIRRASFDEYAKRYWDREVMKGFTTEPTPATPEARLELMRTKASGKMRDWFPNADWYLVRVETPEALGHLMMIDCEITRREGLVTSEDTRLLGWGVSNARQMNYFQIEKPGRERHHDYYQVMEAGHVKLQGDNCLVLCTLDGERNQVDGSVLYYLHDGFGRSLPYLTLVDEGRIPFQPVEALLAVRRG